MEDRGQTVRWVRAGLCLFAALKTESSIEHRMSDHAKTKFSIFNFQLSTFNFPFASGCAARFCRCAARGLVFAIACLISASAARAEAQKPLWDPAGVEDFSLTECHGQAVTKADLLGKPWVACFIFTRCAGPDFCPRVSQQMQILQERL